MAMMGHGLLLAAAVMLGACGIGGHLRRRMVERRHRGDRHRMTQLADDQTGHQQENQRPALPPQFAHGARVQANLAVRNVMGRQFPVGNEAAFLQGVGSA